MAGRGDYLCKRVVWRGRRVDEWISEEINGWTTGYLEFACHCSCTHLQRRGWGGWGTAGRVMVGREWGALVNEGMVCSSSAHEMKPQSQNKNVSFRQLHTVTVQRQRCGYRIITDIHTRKWKLSRGWSLVMKEISFAPTRWLKGPITGYLCC